MNYSNIPANSPLETRMKRESCFCKAAAWGFLSGCHCFVCLFCCCSCCFVLFYVCACKKYQSTGIWWNRPRSFLIIAVTNNSRGLQWKHFVNHVTAPSEGNMHVYLPTSTLCRISSVSRERLDTPCGLHAIYNSFLEPYMITSSPLIAPGSLQSSLLETCPTGRSDTEFPTFPSPEQLHRITSCGFLQGWLC